MTTESTQRGKPWAYALALFGLMLVAHCLQLLQPGFFWDDWQAIFLGQLHQPAAYWDYFLADRPLSAWTYIVTMPILGNSTLAWQLFSLALRWAANLGFVSTLCLVFPRQTSLAKVVGFLLAVYPGFTQQAISVAYSQHFIALAMYSASLLLMVKAALHPRKRKQYISLAAVFTLINMLTIEYFAGLEALRPLLLWFVLQEPAQPARKTAWRVFQLWWPFLLAGLVFVAYRFYFYPALYPQFESNPPILLENLLAEPLPWLLRLTELITQDGLFAVIFSWLNPLFPAEFDLDAKNTYFSWGLGLLAGAGVYLFLSRLPSAEQTTKRETYRWLILGGLAFLFGGLPVWSTNRQAIVGTFSNRFTLGMMLGAVLLLATGVKWLFSGRRKGILLIAFLISAGVAQQLQELNRYRLHWELQRNYTWQLLWRAPGIQTNTAIIGPVLPYGLSGDYAVAFYHNLIYAPQFDIAKLPYWWYNGKRTWNTNQIQSKEPGDALKAEFRSARFESTVSESMPVAFNPGGGCLLVLDPVYAKGPELNFEKDFYAWANPARALREPNANDKFIQKLFGEEPSGGWCKYFQKADLARQYKDWPGAVQLWEEAQKQNLAPEQAREFIPFIEAFGQTGNLEQAARLAEQALEMDGEAAEMVCAIWQRVPGLSTAKLPRGCEN